MDPVYLKFVHLLHLWASSARYIYYKKYHVFFAVIINEKRGHIL